MADKYQVWAERSKHYSTSEWRERRKEALERDDYTCQDCGHEGQERVGNRDNPLTVHHIVERANGGSDDLSNLITKCRKCHSKSYHYCDD